MTDHGNPTTIGQALAAARRLLTARGIESPALDAEVLLMHHLDVTRETLYAHMDVPLSSTDQSAYDELIRRRIDGVPVAYLTGERQFYGRRFAVNADVLVPRPETEYLVEWTARRTSSWTDKRRRTIVDVGTGSGAIALSVALEIEDRALVIGSDVSLQALAVAQENRLRLGARAELVAGSLLDWYRGSVDIITANLPYLRPDQEHEGIRFEPRVALFAGEDGFALSRTLIGQAAGLLTGDGALIMEIDPAQHDLARDTARAWFPDASVTIEPDLAGHERYLIVARSA